jgi:glycosyltransferase involved in cell wall biosynthesis
MSTSTAPVKVAVTYRVCQQWRAPVFARLNNDPEITLTVYYGQDVAGTKLKSISPPQDFGMVKHITISVPGFPFVFHPFLFFSLLRDRPEVVVAEGGSNFFNNFSVLLYCTIFRKPLVWWTLGELPGREKPKTVFSAAFRCLKNWQEGRATVYLGYSSRALDYFKRRGFPAERCFRAVNVIDTDMPKELELLRDENRKIVRSALNIKEGPVIMFSGAIALEKRLDRLLKIFSRVLTRFPHAHLIVAGDGPQLLETKKLAGDLKLDGHAHFIGRKERRDLAAYFHSADLFVLPGLGGLAISEALAHGLPVVCGVADGCEVDLIRCGFNGDIVTGSSEQELIESYVESIVKFLGNDCLLSRGKDEAIFTIDNCYNIQNYINEVKRSIKKAIELAKLPRQSHFHQNP